MTSEFDLDAKGIKKLAEILVETDLSEIEYQHGEKMIRVARHRETQSVFVSPHQSAMPTPPSSSAPAPATPSEPAQSANDEAVKSPMVGTAYLSPEPGAATFVKVGDTVKEGDKLLIIEAMKVMNPIKAPCSGIIKKILIADSKPVEFNESLMLIERN